MARRWKYVSDTFWSNHLADPRTEVKSDFIHTMSSYVVVPDLRGLEVGGACSAMSVEVSYPMYYLTGSHEKAKTKAKATELRVTSAMVTHRTLR